ncbi:MAG: efflux RND transporter permease subunit [Gammaproteobacteria bacterium]|nr:efflux RND transporter permease subunit [Gammaproteobacteria bacterium]
MVDMKAKSIGKGLGRWPDLPYCRNKIPSCCKIADISRWTILSERDAHPITASFRIPPGYRHPISSPLRPCQEIVRPAIYGCPLLSYHAVSYCPIMLVWEFGNLIHPAIIMTPIPLTLIGIIPGHWLLDAEFTATSMIGFIALAGIEVRSSILLVDFAKNEIHRSTEIREAVVRSGQIRMRPIWVTNLTLIVVPLGCISTSDALVPKATEADAGACCPLPPP